MKLEGAVYVEVERIVVHRAARQRREIEIESDGLRQSVAERGVLSPLLLRKEGMELVFGERRLTAATVNGLSEVPVLFLENLSPQEAEVIELEENLKRSELPWRDEVVAIARIHRAYKSLAEAKGHSWAVSATGEVLNNSQVQIALRVAESIDSPRIREATSIRMAFNALSRLDDRALADFMGDITDAGQEIITQVKTQDIETGPGGVAQAVDDPTAVALPGEEKTVVTEVKIGPKAAADSIICGDFLLWAAQYAGPRFNFIHCDFPYGKGVFNGPQSGRHKWTEADGGQPYSDEADVYWNLIEGLCGNLDRLMAPSAHLMFWLENDCEVQAQTIQRFRSLAPGLVFNTTPLVWWKTDNVGVLSDPKRGPRNVYETALVASREDRLIVRAVSNAYGAPTAKRSNESIHPSEKPEPVLRHFMQMFVDENSRVLDPTCGGGSALRAAESLGAAHVLGLEQSPEWHSAAVTALRQFRVKKAGSR